MTARTTGAVRETPTNVSPTKSPGLMALRPAREWSLGKTTIMGSLTRRRNVNSGRSAPRASTQSHERDASAVALLPLPQDHGSVDSAMAVTCAAFARRPPSYFRLPQSQQNIEDVVAPFRLPCPQGIGASLTKYVANGALPHPTRQSISATRESEIRGAGEKQ